MPLDVFVKSMSIDGMLPTTLGITPRYKMAMSIDGMLPTTLGITPRWWAKCH